MVGKAGTGKTYALEVAREAWQTAGVQVTGVALAARAALELEQSAGLRSTTLVRLLGQLDDHRDGSPLQPGSVLVVDEAGMIGTRQLARLLDHAEAQSVKVVLVGDPKQLPEIDAGGLFRAVSTRLPAIELADNRRQRHEWEQAALGELRHGNPDTALAAYRQHGRIHTADTPDQIRTELVNDWWATAKDDLPGSLMIALRHDDVADLNQRARVEILISGRLTGPTLQVGEDEFRAGDRIVCLRNDRRLGVVNATRATVTHGYAMTGHKAQGLTCDHTYALGTETLYREWRYVATSRGRLTNQLYHGAEVDDDGALHHHVHLAADVPDLTSRLRRTRAETPVSPELAEIASARQELSTRLGQIHLQTLWELHRAFDQLGERPRMLAGTVERLQLRLAEEGKGGLSRFRRRGTIQEFEAELESATASLADVTQRVLRRAR